MNSRKGNSGLDNDIWENENNIGKKIMNLKQLYYI